MNTICSWTLLVAAISLLVGCDDGSRDREHGPEISISDSAGVVMIQNNQPDARLAVEEVRRIGVVEGAEPYQLFQIQALTEDGLGRVYVGNGMTATVRVFSQDGTFLTEFGGRGEGPGEFTMINDVFPVGANVALVDWQGGGRVAVFTPEGELVDTWRGFWGGGRPAFPWGHGDGGWVGVVYASPPEGEPTPGARYETKRAVYRMLPPPAPLGDVLVEIPPRVLYGSVSAHGMDWGLFRAEPAVGLSASGQIFLAPGPEYLISVFDAFGRLTRQIRRDHEPVPVTDSDVAEYRRTTEAYLRQPQFFERRGGQEGLRRTLARIDEQATFPRPATLAPIGDIKASADGSIWVRRKDHWSPAQVEHEASFLGFDGVPESPTRWDLFGPEGRYRGTVELPARFRVHAVTADAATGVLKDEMDVEFVVTFQLAPA